VIRKLADYFKVSQEAFNRSYKSAVPENAHLRNVNVMNTKKKLDVARFVYLSKATGSDNDC